MAFDSDGNLYLATGDNTNPFESDGFTPIDERAGRQDYDAQRTAGNTNDLRGKVLRIHPEADGTYTVPAGQPVRRRARRRPGPRSTRWASATRSGSASTRRPTRSTSPTTARTPARATRTGARRGRSSGTSSARPATTAGRTATATTTRTTTTRSRPGRAGAKFNCAAPVNNSPNNTGLTNLPPAVPATVDYDYSGNPLFPEIGGGGAPMGGPVYRYDADLDIRPQVAGVLRRQGALRRVEPEQDVHVPGRPPTARRWWTSTSCSTGMTFMRPMDFEFGPDGALYLIEWGTGFGGNNDDSGVYRIDYIAGDRAPIAVASGEPDVRAGAADRAVLQRRLPRPGRRHAHLRLDVRRRRHLHRRPNPTHTYTDRRQLHRPADGHRHRPAAPPWPTCRSPSATPRRRSPSSSRRTAASSTGATRSTTRSP